MLHETGTLAYDKIAAEQMPDENSAIFVCTRHEVLLKDGDNLELPTHSLAAPLCDSFEYVFTMDGRAFYLGFPSAAIRLDGYGLRPLRDVRSGTPKNMVYACATGHHLYRWYRSRTFCGVCGQRTQRSKQERLVLCPSCGHFEYPTIMPAVIVGVINGDELLLTRIRGGMPGALRWWPAMSRSAKRWRTPYAGKYTKKRGSWLPTSLTTKASHGHFPARCWRASSCAWQVRLSSAPMMMNLRTPLG